MIATYFNCLTVIIGSLLGLLLRSRIKENFKTVVFASAGLVTLVIGFSMALAVQSYLVMLFALVLGGFCGYALRIETGVLNLGSWIERRFNRTESGATEASGASNFAKGFLSASLLFCAGAMTIVGSIEAGTTGNYKLIMLKSVMDGCMAIIFAAAYGPGVLASSVVILLYQGFLTLCGSWLSPLLGESGLNALSSVGGVLLLMIGFGLLGLKEFKAANFLPALVLAPLFAWVAPYLTKLFPYFA